MTIKSAKLGLQRPVELSTISKSCTELARLIQRGLERSEFHAVDAEATVITLTALYEGLALLLFVDPQAIQWAEQIETAVRLLLSGLQRPSAS